MSTEATQQMLDDSDFTPVMGMRGAPLKEERDRSSCLVPSNEVDAEAPCYPIRTVRSLPLFQPEMKCKLHAIVAFPNLNKPQPMLTLAVGIIFNLPLAVLSGSRPEANLASLHFFPLIVF
ncbi:hypothetical protein FBUS_05627 [Fasciolopsis buskii]|uniref:Uncharacterized protein n=1 Tax=Fasciolopsis buskii TaxID=27845 RepID=A0A8E0RJ62_9TREM|nr:hypothetical protein FBUS_05627 [Fasciolopsis buski]